MSEIWIQCFTCCVTEQPQTKRRRARIDRTMIGEPTNFRHTGHIGSGDMQLGTNNLMAIQNQMQSKGGYEYAIPVSVPMVMGAIRKDSNPTFSPLNNTDYRTATAIAAR